MFIQALKYAIVSVGLFMVWISYDLVITAKTPWLTVLALMILAGNGWNTLEGICALLQERWNQRFYYTWFNSGLTIHFTHPSSPRPIIMTLEQAERLAERLPLVIADTRLMVRM